MAREGVKPSLLALVLAAGATMALGGGDRAPSLEIEGFRIECPFSTAEAKTCVELANELELHRVGGVCSVGPDEILKVERSGNAIILKEDSAASLLTCLALQFSKGGDAREVAAVLGDGGANETPVGFVLRFGDEVLASGSSCLVSEMGLYCAADVWDGDTLIFGSHALPCIRRGVPDGDGLCEGRLLFRSDRFRQILESSGIRFDEDWAPKPESCPGRGRPTTETNLVLNDGPTNEPIGRLLERIVTTPEPVFALNRRKLVDCSEEVIASLATRLRSDRPAPYLAVLTGRYPTPCYYDGVTEGMVAGHLLDLVCGRMGRGMPDPATWEKNLGRLEDWLRDRKPGSEVPLPEEFREGNEDGVAAGRGLEIGDVDPATRGEVDEPLDRQ